MRQLLNRQTLLWVTGFSISMGFLETAVVVYLRDIYYPEGFNFPLVPVTGIIGITELIRELATMVMLISLGVMAGRNFPERFAYFLLSFAIWDIFYYIFLKMLLNWPESLLTWDLLFLLPLPWVGPVIAPVTNALSMILLASIILHYSALNVPAGLKKPEWLLLISGSVILIISYTWDYSAYMMRAFKFSTLISFSDPECILEHAGAYIPVRFQWWIFSIGQILILLGIIRYFQRIRKLQSI